MHPMAVRRRSPAWYRRLAGVMKAAYAERLASLGESEPLAAESCTTHLTTCDAEGNTVAMTTTLMSSFGSRVLLPQSGVLLNNGMMWFDPRPGTPNSIAPGKRPLCNMLPIMLTENGRPYLAAGASGGRRIMASVFQLMTFLADFGMSVEDAAHQPRIDVSSVDKTQCGPATATRRARRVGSRTDRWKSSSTARCRSTSPARM